VEDKEETGPASFSVNIMKTLEKNKQRPLKKATAKNKKKNKKKLTDKSKINPMKNIKNDKKSKKVTGDIKKNGKKIIHTKTQAAQVKRSISKSSEKKSLITASRAAKGPKAKGPSKIIDDEFSKVLKLIREQMKKVGGKLVKAGISHAGRKIKSLKRL
jgi:hypothetical protein